MSAASPQTRTAREPVLVSMSVLAALQMFFAGSSGVSILTDNDLIAGIMAVGALAVAAAQVGIQFYVRGEVTANANVVEWVKGGKVIAGPANEHVDPGLVVRDTGETPQPPETDPEKEI